MFWKKPPPQPFSQSDFRELIESAVTQAREAKIDPRSLADLLEQKAESLRVYWATTASLF